MGIRHTPKSGDIIIYPPKKHRRDKVVFTPKFRDLSDYRVSEKRPRRPKPPGNPRNKRPRIPDSPIPEENFYAVFGRYRSREPQSHSSYYGKGPDGLPLGPNSLLGKFVTYKKGKPNTSVSQFVGGTLKRSASLTQTWDQKNPGPPYRNGGPFFSSDSRLPHSASLGNVLISNLGAPGITNDNMDTYYGTIIDNGFWSTDSLSNYLTSKPSPRVLNEYHTLAWDRLKPPVAQVNVAQFLYELKDLPHMLKTSAEGFGHAWERDSTLVRNTYGKKLERSLEFMAPREAADHFLNHQFGWAPFVSDIIDVIRVYRDSRDLIAQAVIDNGKWKRRRRVLEVVENHTRLQRIYGAATLPGSGNFRFDNLCEARMIDGISSKGITEIWLKESKITWAVGSFMFYRPEFDDNLIGFESELMNVQRLLTLYGVRINPTTLWKITPWSWLIDWFTHLGDFIQRWDDFVNDGIVSKYLYVMQKNIRAVTKSGTAFCYSGNLNFSWQRNLTTKRREPADSPYGFNRPWSSITPNQWAILGAIGLGRTPSARISTGL